MAHIKVRTLRPNSWVKNLYLQGYVPANKQGIIEPAVVVRVLRRIVSLIDMHNRAQLKHRRKEAATDTPANVQ